MKRISFHIARRLAFNRQRSFSRMIIRIATAAVAISVAVMIIGFAMVRGFQHEISQKVFGLWGQVQITKFSPGDSYESRPIADDGSVFEVLDTIPGIAHVQRFITKPAIMKTRDQIEGVIMKGVGTDFDFERFKPFIVEGGLSLDDQERRYGILISQSTANRLSLGVNDTIAAHFVDPGSRRLLRRRFGIDGIYKTGLEEFDKKFVFGDIAVLQSVNGWGQDSIGGYEVLLHDPDLMDSLGRRIDYAIDPELKARSIREIGEVRSIFDWLDLQSINEDVILILMLMVSVVNMITALLILILERTNMIGVLKALGLSDGRIMGVFLYHAGYIVCIGLFMGNVVGIGLCWLQKRFGLLRLPEDTYYVDVAPVKVEWLTILGLDIATAVICLVALVLPALLVLTVSPVKALRFE